MKLQIILGVLRHMLTGLGGVLVAKGLADDSQIGEAAGAICTLVGLAWSVWHKRQDALKVAGPLAVVLCLSLLCGCVFAQATRSVTSAAGVTTSETIQVKAFLESIGEGQFSTTNGMTLSTTQTTPDQQSIAILSTVLGEVAKGALLLAKPSTNLPPAAVTNP